MKEHLKQILESIHNILLYSDENTRHYIALLKDALQTIENIDAKTNSLLDIYKNQALTELANELANRVNENFFNADTERKKSEFKFSKALVIVSITNVISNY